MPITTLTRRFDRQVLTESDAGPLLNEPQLRHFAVFLSMLEAALSEVDLLTTDSRSTAQRSLTADNLDLPHDFRRRAIPAIEAIGREIAALVRTLDIKPHGRSRRRQVKALLTAELVRLDDSYARKLRGYGPVSRRVALEVDPFLDRIRSQLVDLLRACEDEGLSSAHGAQ